MASTRDDRVRRRCAGPLACLVLLLGLPVAAAVAEPVDEAACKRGKKIERVLGNHGFRVVVGGGYEVADGRPVKVQIWENEARDWVITEAFLKQNRTCVVRSGIRLHMLY